MQNVSVPAPLFTGVGTETNRDSGVSPPGFQQFFRGGDSWKHLLLRKDASFGPATLCGRAEKGRWAVIEMTVSALNIFHPICHDIFEPDAIPHTN